MSARSSVHAIVLACAVRALVLGVLWVVLAGWDSDYAVYGLVSVAAAAALSFAVLPLRAQQAGGGGVRALPRRAWSWGVLLSWFLWQSAVGGADVALRAVKPQIDIDPRVVEAPCTLPPGHARQLAMLLMNLMPGTMIQRDSAQCGGAATVELHTLSLSLEPVQQWERLQAKTAAAYGLG